MCVRYKGSVVDLSLSKIKLPRYVSCRVYVNDFSLYFRCSRANLKVEYGFQCLNNNASSCRDYKTTVCSPI